MKAVVLLSLQITATWPPGEVVITESQAVRVIVRQSQLFPLHENPGLDGWR
jgi:hypothetical protein